MNWYKLAQNMHNMQFQKEHNPDWESYYPPFRDDDPAMQKEENHFQGKNVTWIAEKGSTIWVDSDRVYPWWGNNFYNDKINAVVQNIQDGEGSTYFEAPYGHFTVVNEQILRQSIEYEGEGEYRALSTGYEDT
jgi:hypothetical protein